MMGANGTVDAFGAPELDPDEEITPMPFRVAPPASYEARLATLEAHIANLASEVKLLRTAEYGARKELTRLLAAAAVGGPAGFQALSQLFGG